MGRRHCRAAQTCWLSFSALRLWQRQWRGSGLSGGMKGLLCCSPAERVRSLLCCWFWLANSCLSAAEHCRSRFSISSSQAFFMASLRNNVYIGTVRSWLRYRWVSRGEGEDRTSLLSRAAHTASPVLSLLQGLGERFSLAQLLCLPWFVSSPVAAETMPKIWPSRRDRSPCCPGSRPALL